MITSYIRHLFALMSRGANLQLYYIGGDFVMGWGRES